MKRYKKTFVSNLAAAMLAFSLAQGSAVWADEAPDTNFPDAMRADTAQTKLSQDKATLAKTPLAKTQLTKTWAVTTNPIAPISMIAGMGLLALAFSVLGGRHNMKGAWWRATAGGMLTLHLLHPEFLQEERELLPTEVAIVVDKSASQSLDERDKTTSLMQTALVEQLSKMHGVNIRIIEVEGTKNGVAVDGTQLFTALNAGLSDVSHDRLGAVFIFTDGQVHDIPEKNNLLENGVPLHVLLSGKKDEYDRRIILDQTSRFGLVNKEQKIRFHIRDEGRTPNEGEKIGYTVRHEGREIATGFAAPDNVVETRVNVPHTGANIIEITTDSLPGELTTVNNRVVTTIEGIREALSVLLLSGKPDANTRMWRDLLKSDPDTNLVHFTVLRGQNQDDKTPRRELSLIAVPTDEVFSEKINDFDLIIFDHYEERGLLKEQHFNNITNYVRNGGALLTVAGPEYIGGGSVYGTSLSSILPAAPASDVIKAPYIPQVTDLGKRHPVTRNLEDSNTDDPSQQPSWGHWYLLVNTAVPLSGDVIMTGADNKPLLILDHRDKGRIAMLMSDNAWLWARGHEGGGPSAELLRRTAHWLMKAPSLEEEALRMSIKNDALTIEQQTIAEKSTPVTVKTPSGKTVMVTPTLTEDGFWRSTIPADEVGLYSAEQAGKQLLTAFINAGSRNPKEFISTLSTPDLLRPFVRETGGQIKRMLDKEGHLDVPRLISHRSPKAGKEMNIRMSEASTLKRTHRTPLIPGWLGVISILGALAAAYYREGDGTLPFKKIPPKTGGPKNDGP